MSSPTEAEVQAQISNVTNLLEETRKFGNVNAKNFVALQDVITQSMEGDYSDGVLNAVSVLRENLNGAVSNENAAAALAPLFLTYAKTLKIPFTDIPSIFAALSEDFALTTPTPKTVQSRGITYGAPAAGGSNIGTGVLNRLTEGRYGYDLEALTIEDKLCEIIRDEHSGAERNEEVGQLEGEAATRDVVDLSGSGLITEIVAVSARQTSTYVSNPSFDAFEGDVGSGNLSGLDGWTPTTPGDFSSLYVDQTAANVYRGSVGVTTPASLVFVGNEKIVQAFSVTRATFDPNVPVYVQIAWNKDLSAGVTGTGSLILRWGAVSVTVNVTTSGTGWQLARIPIDSSLWHLNWNETLPDIEIETTGNTGEITVDDVIVTPMTFFDGTYYALVGGRTPFLRKDSFSWGDTETGAINQYWFWRAFGLSLPSSGTPTWLDPV